MGLFSIFKKKNETTGTTTNASASGAATTTVTAPATTAREGWWLECEPACGFKVVTHNKAELVHLVQHHSKNTHNKTVTEAEVWKLAKPI